MMMLRLFIFEILVGHRTAVWLLICRHGLREGVTIALLVFLRQLFANPFARLREKPKTLQEKCSRRQLAPALILYDVLIERGFSKNDARNQVRLLVKAVAMAFLKFSVPLVPEQSRMPADEKERLRLFKNTCARFFNADGDVQLTGSRLSFFVDHCWFADYCRRLGYQQLAGIFCSADASYFESQQPNVVFARSKTLANGDEHCDFVFHIRP